MPSSEHSKHRAQPNTNELSESKDLLSIVSPCYNESEVIRLFYTELKQVLESLEDLEHEIIFVDDGSTDDTLAQLNQIAHKDSRVRVCSLSRNFGHEIAMTAGLDTAEGDAVITMDVDLQHPPALIPHMINKWKDGYDIVSPVRDSTEGISWFKKATAKGFYSILNLLTETRIPAGVSDFNLFSRRAYMALRAMPERHRFVRGMASWIGFNRAFLQYSATKRAAGKSKYTVMKLVALALDGIFSFSAAPLRIATKFGLIITLSGFVYLIWIVGRYFLYGVITPGWASLIGVMLILGGCQLVFIGLIGQYLSRVFEEVKGRPIYIVKQEPPSLQRSSNEQEPQGSESQTES